MKSIKKLSIFVALAIFVLFPVIVLAHNPRIVKDGESVTEIKKPEISQAFYGQLSGEPHWFEFEAKDKFDLYVNILLPMAAKEKDVSVEIYRQEWLIGWLDADNMKWKEFHELFAGDDYWQGESYDRTETPDVYRLKVYSKKNTEKYVLVVGSDESFSLSEFGKTILILPQLKRDFFGVSPWSAYFNYVGLLVLAVIIALVALIFLGFKLMRKFQNKNNQ
ncbi:MAG: hypothetical protein PHQ47_01090 [Candidatus Portnoybacteria bacterium]|nr:hypothetical protein [Candidatus Portnoybacteria bacterium]